MKQQPIDSRDLADSPNPAIGDVFRTASGTQSSRLPNGIAGIKQIPLEGLRRIGRIFLEGEVKHGRDNWKQGYGDPEFYWDRFDHALNHILLYASGDRTEDHLAKVGWAMVVLMELGEPKIPVPHPLEDSAIEKLAELERRKNAFQQQQGANIRSSF